MVVQTLDVRGEICPDPLALTIKEMQGLKAGDLLKVLVDSPIALETICRWARHGGHRVVGVNELGPAQWELALEKLVA